LSDSIRHRRRREQGTKPDPVLMERLRESHKLSFPNPLPSLRILMDMESALIMLVSGLGFTLFFAIQTGASKAFRDVYGFSDSKIALMFISIGVGGILSAFTTGKLIDWNFRQHARKLGLEIRRGVRTDLTEFPVEKARLQIMTPLMTVGVASALGYGWMLEAGRISLAGPIIMLFLFGYTMLASVQALNVLLVDIWPGKAAACTAANNLARLSLGAASSAAIEPMIVAMGYGWAYTTLSLISFASLPTLVIMMRRGIEWRKKKREREERKRSRKDEKERARKEVAEKTVRPGKSERKS
jgi:predicted MFS family arabinose efflux permease